MVSIICVLFLSFISSYILVVRDTHGFYKTWNYRIETIKENKKNINKFEFETHYTTKKQSPSYGLGDLYPEYNDINNRYVARYFGIKGIKAK